MANVGGTVTYKEDLAEFKTQFRWCEPPPDLTCCDPQYYALVPHRRNHSKYQPKSRAPCCTCSLTLLV
ncbi:hypothetical protein PISMIDRAFT_601396 [Pisolithus microcarpus 441]|uniref:Uncharacterized protein n=1 Tax=Pisolithus microcarpus 441 TaxID=765257 RepID=A0A0C9Z1B0_9AGAM|nr:hypothetical protein PISMIDRAFT_601396 [Pisolithus microcarpus 441]